MAASCKKCDPHEICEECPEWIFTLADLIMCMMGLFVILWVLKPGGAPTPDGKPVNNDAQNEVVAAIREAFGYLPDAKSNDPIDLILIQKAARQHRPMNGPGDGGKTVVPDKSMEGLDREVQTIRKGNLTTIGGRILFDTGKAALTSEATKMLDDISQSIKGHRNVFLVRGHTSLDDLPETADSKQKLDLSMRRAQAVNDYLVGKGVEPQILRVLACSTFEPIVQRQYTADARRQNQRVEVEATSTLVSEFQEQPATAPTTQQGAATHSSPAAKEHH